MAWTEVTDLCSGLDGGDLRSAAGAAGNGALSSSGGAGRAAKELRGGRADGHQAAKHDQGLHGCQTGWSTQYGGLSTQLLVSCRCQW